MNVSMIIGRLTKDPEIKYTSKKGMAVCRATVAVDRRFKKEDGTRDADFIPVAIFGKPAEAIKKYSGKGKLIGVKGRIQTSSYDAKDGTKKYTTELVVEEVQFLEWAKKDDHGPQYPDDNVTPVDGDIPF